MHTSWIGHYVVAAVIFGVLDGLWLGSIGKPLYGTYARELGCPVAALSSGRAGGAGVLAAT